jgi:hypothetical protein
MGEIHHDPPNILITNGTASQEHRFYLATESGADVILESRVGIFGELIRRCYRIQPLLPEVIRGNPDAFLEKLSNSLKIQNFEKDQDLWIYRIEFRRDDLKLPAVVRHESIPMWEKMLHGMMSSNRMMFDLTPNPFPIEASDFYETR